VAVGFGGEEEGRMDDCAVGTGPGYEVAVFGCCFDGRGCHECCWVLKGKSSKVIGGVESRSHLKYLFIYLFIYLEPRKDYEGAMNL